MRTPGWEPAGHSAASPGGGSYTDARVHTPNSPQSRQSAPRHFSPKGLLTFCAGTQKFRAARIEPASASPDAGRYVEQGYHQP